MTTEELKGIGLTDEQANSVFAMHGKSITALKTQIGEKDTEIGNLNAQISTANDKLKGYDPEWSQKAEQAKLDAEKELNEYKFNNALDNALSTKKATASNCYPMLLPKNKAFLASKR